MLKCEIALNSYKGNTTETLDIKFKALSKLMKLSKFVL